ncbi:hypothetical protein GQX73_g9373 [Xylaria multiplex]|uniref:Methyltransferase domain-containing protein n=1 Tax=Xylaria multiplex TaxID=323545 RepID=A0A7C8MNT4_9PEZI|nr:hypothetical protein GQX73_g9373 [Xylaria multiplex]
MVKNLTWASLAILPLLLVFPSSWNWAIGFLLNAVEKHLTTRRAHLSEEAWRVSTRLRQEWLDKSAKTVGALFPTRKENAGEAYVVWDFFPPTYSCPWDVRRLGNLGDGGKWICGMSKYESVLSRPIVVYSFGIGDDSSFEADLLAMTSAQVFAFDYTTDGFGPEISTNDSGTSFEKLALGGEDGHRNDVEYQTLTSIMQRLGHDYVDIIKMDIEGDEFPALTKLMDENAGKELPIGQLLVEFHHWGENQTVQEFAQWWDRFEGFGMRPVWCEANLITVTWETGFPCCAEYVWVNTHDSQSILWK